MVAIKLENFGGSIPAIDDRLLPPNNASYSENAWLGHGYIEPVHSYVPIHTMASPTSRSWFRIPKGNPGLDYMSDSTFLEFDSPFVRVVRNPTSQSDDDGRYYWADGTLPKYTTGARVSGGQPILTLGIPTPTAGPVVTPSGGVSTVATTRAYVYTWVSSYGEEGPPSPPAVVDGLIDDTWAVTVTAPTAGDELNRSLESVRLYRTVTSTQGVATYFFVAEFPNTTTSYNDFWTDAVVAANEPLQSTNWQAPLADLQGFVAMPNGIIASWRKNEVWFCEPYRPHAWPAIYTIGVEATIVGLGVMGQTVAILTEGQPYTANGVHPSNMALAKVQPLEACTARNSIVSTPQGVLYSSPNGLINITPAGATNVTRDMIHKEQWSELMNIDNIHATMLDGGYYCYSGVTAGVFQADTFDATVFEQQDHTNSKEGLYIAVGNNRIGAQVLNSDTAVLNAITDAWTGETTVLRGGVVYHLDIRKLVAYGRYTWRSKIFQSLYFDNLSVAKIFYDPPWALTDAPTMFRFYAGEKRDNISLRLQRALPSSGKMFRLPSGFKANFFQVEVEGTALIDSIQFATSAEELRTV